MTQTEPDALELPRTSAASEFDLDGFERVRWLDWKGGVHVGYLLIGPSKDRNGIAYDDQTRRVYGIDFGQYKSIRPKTTGNLAP